jgi:hypothetical protein
VVIAGPFFHRSSAVLFLLDNGDDLVEPTLVCQGPGRRRVSMWINARTRICAVLYEQPYDLRFARSEYCGCSDAIGATLYARRDPNF